MANSKRPDEPRDSVKNKRAMFEQLARDNEEKSKAASKQRAQTKAAAKPKAVAPHAKKEGKRDVPDKTSKHVYTLPELVHVFPENPPKISAAMKEKDKGQKFEQAFPRMYSDFIVDLKEAQRLEKELGDSRTFGIVELPGKEKHKGEAKKKLDLSKLSFKHLLSLMNSVKDYRQELGKKHKQHKGGVSDKQPEKVSAKKPERVPEEKPLPADLDEAIKEQEKRLEQLRHRDIKGINVGTGAGRGQAGSVRNPKFEGAQVKYVSLLLDRFDRNFENAIQHMPRRTSRLGDERSAMKEILNRVKNLPGHLNDATKFAIQEKALEHILNSLGSEFRFGFNQNRTWVPDSMKEKQSDMAKYVSAMYEDLKKANEEIAKAFEKDASRKVDPRKVDEGLKTLRAEVSTKARIILSTEAPTAGKRSRGK